MVIALVAGMRRVREAITYGRIHYSCIDEAEQLHEELRLEAVTLKREDGNPDLPRGRQSP